MGPKRAEVRRRLERDEELRAVAVRAAVGHRQRPAPRMRQGEALIGKLAPIYGLAARAIAAGKVSALRVDTTGLERWDPAGASGVLCSTEDAKTLKARLGHEAFYDAVEGASFVPDGLASGRRCRVADAQPPVGVAESAAS